MIETTNGQAVADTLPAVEVPAAERLAALRRYADQLRAVIRQQQAEAELAAVELEGHRWKLARVLGRAAELEQGQAQ